MGTITKADTLFEPELVTEIFSKVKGHSALAALCNSAPMPFAGTDQFVFSMDGEASIVGEGKSKPAGDAEFKKITIKPIKFVYQHRLTDEFVKLSQEKQLPYLETYTDGFARKMARALDIGSIHGVNPYDNVDSPTIGNNCFDKAVTANVSYDPSAPDDCIDAAVRPIQDHDGVVTGIAMAPAFAAALGAIKSPLSNAALYPEFRFGATPKAFGGMACDVNGTVAFKNSPDRAIVGDFANAFRWGYAEDISIEIIEYGDPDGQGDLKKSNEIVLRSEAYIGWGIIDPTAFAKITESPLKEVTLTGETGTKKLFNTTVSDMQTGVIVKDGYVSGNLKYLTEGELVKKFGEGNFIGLKFDNLDPAATSVKVGLEPSSGSGLVEIKDDPDKNGAFKITDKAAQKFVIVSTDGENTTKQAYDLSGLFCQDQASAIAAAIKTTSTKAVAKK